MSAIKNIKPLNFPWETSDPFLFCAYHEDQYPKGNENLGPDDSLAGRVLGQDFAPNSKGWRMYHGKTVPGFPAHPHRGFETVTIVQKGLVDHADSLRGGGRFGHGDVQWMTAGRGVQHSEMFPLLNQEDENPFLLFQIWLNLPRDKKLTEPYYGMFWHEDIPVHEVESEKGKTAITIVAGDLEDKKALTPSPDSWAANPDNEVAIWTIKMDPGSEWELPLASEGINRSLFYFKGDDCNFNDQRVSVESIIELNADQKMKITNGERESHFLLLQGRPINEPVAQYGPFVMNTQAEIQQSMMEFQQTEFGGWPWPKPDQVHDKTRGRFAKYADGTEDVR